MESFSNFYKREHLKTESFKGLAAGAMLGLSTLTGVAKDKIIPLPTKFVHTINQVESSGRHDHVKPGDNGAALGPFQIHKAYWKDAVEYDPSIGGKYEDVNNYDYALKVITAYLNRYGQNYIRANNFDALARIHNGGGHALTPSRIHLTDTYDKRFKNKLKREV